MDTMFLNACKAGQKGVIEAFLKKGGININKRDALGNTPLYYVCIKGARDLVQLLIQAGADVSQANNNSQAPIHRIAENGNKEIITLLIAGGADINATDKEGKTPLLYAIKAGKTETALFFLSQRGGSNHQRQRRF
ncbi:ankyrin repeat protein [Myroides gitamensis]|nr:ankyrin repeat protein [Myroides gitamensis]